MTNFHCRLRFNKYQALRNDYIVVDPNTNQIRLTPAIVKRICDRHLGIGSDGVLWGPFRSKKGNASVRIFNPDGSEAEKSGNGLRIFSRYLFDNFYIREGESVLVETQGGDVLCRVESEGRVIEVAMGRASFAKGECQAEDIVLDDGSQVTGVVTSMGNPHFVIICQECSKDIVCSQGPLVERHPRFQDRTNVQFVQILDRHRIRVEIWERGAGYTLSSGSSASAAAAVVVAQGLCESPLRVEMSGGGLDVTVSSDQEVIIRGQASPIGSGQCSAEMFDETLNQELCPDGCASSSDRSCGEKSSVAEITSRFDADADRFSDADSGQQSMMDSSIILDILTRVAALVKPDARSVLDIGCGAGNFSLRLLKVIIPASLTIIDLSSVMIERAISRLKASFSGELEAIVGDIRESHFPLNRFDIVIAGGVLHHLRTKEEWYRVYRRLHQAMLPGAMLLVADLIDHDDARTAEVMNQRYDGYLVGIGGDEYRERVRAYMAREDSPRSINFQFQVLDAVGFVRCEVLHKQGCFALISAQKA